MSNLRYFRGEPVALGGDTVIQSLPVTDLDQHSPFLLIHHFGPETMRPERKSFRVPPHPHRGFQPVTLVFNGVVRHKDSLGNDSSVGPGGVQWITAGRGIIHSEEADPAFIKEGGGTMELIQLWINLPAARKMEPATYEGFKAEEIPEYIEDGFGRVRIFSGNWKGVVGPVKAKTPLTVSVWEGDEGDVLQFDSNKGWNSMIYCLKGRIELKYSERPMGQYESAVWTAEGSTNEFKAIRPTRALLLSGEPILEPVTQYGPFVMNTQTEIMEAMRDYNQGKMGILVD